VCGGHSMSHGLFRIKETFFSLSLLIKPREVKVFPRTKEDEDRNLRGYDPEFRSFFWVPNRLALE